jgi:hypothetical protein
MPKGRVEPREVTCRACGVEFVTDRPGKAGWYCHGEECDARRKAERHVTPNPNGRHTTEQRAAAQAHRDAERAAAEQRSRAEAEARRNRARAEAEAQRQDGVRQRRLAALRRELDQLEGRRRRVSMEAQEAEELVEAARERIAVLEGKPRPAAPVPRAAPAEPPPMPVADLADLSGDVSELLRRVRLDVVRRSHDGQDVGRRAMRRAIVGVAHASGVPGTREALRALAVEALTWELRLSGKGHAPGEFVADELPSAA